ncbi:MAG: haloalkane dehalogenase [Anaerolineales bacterium]
MKILRTPDDRFANLPDFPFEPHYVEVPAGDGDRLRIHYLDEGPLDADPVLLLHGEPSWSFLYRKMIPTLVAAGFRTVAPDLVGLGRSDKPADPDDYTYLRHVDWMTHFLETLNLQKITLLCQDWGGLIGLRLATETEARFVRLVAANTGLPTGDQKMPEAFLRWQEFSRRVSRLPIGRIIREGCVTKLPPEVVAAYEAPFPDESYKAGARIFPQLVPTTPDNPASEANRRAWQVLRRWEKPFLTAFSDSDPITARGELIFQRLVPGAKGQPHVKIEGAGHFLQEDKGPYLARIIVDFIEQTQKS